MENQQLKELNNQDEKETVLKETEQKNETVFIEKTESEKEEKNLETKEVPVVEASTKEDVKVIETEKEKTAEIKITKEEIKEEINQDAETKVYFIDLDGTLLDTKDIHGKHSISKRNLEAIAKVQSEGKTVVVSTGRAFDAQTWLKMVNSPYAVLSNGAIVVVEDKIVRHLKLTVRQALQIHEFAWKNRLAFKLNDQAIAYGVFSKFQKFITKKLNFIPMENYNFEMHKEYTKFVLWGRSRIVISKLAKSLQEKMPEASVVTSMGGYTIEITNKEATKGNANEWLAKHVLHVKKENTMHIGDTMNDSTAVGHVGKLVAMKNADLKLKALTPYRGPHYKNGGVAKVLEGQYIKK